MKHLRRYLIAGLVVVLPTAVSAYVLWILFVKLDGILGSYIREQTGLSIPGIGLAAIIVILLLAGMMTSSFVGKRLLKLSQRGLEAIPLFNRIYIAVRQISEALLGGHSNVFRQVALVEYPRRGLYSICFVTSENTGEINSRLSRKTVNVFVPTSPNPTSGFMIVVPVDEIIPLKISVEDGMKMVISAGSYAAGATLSEAGYPARAVNSKGLS